MRAKTSIGSSPTGRCSGLDKVPWRDLTLLDKLDIQAWGFHHSSRGSAPCFLRCHDPYQTPLLLFIAVSRILRGPGDTDGGDGRGETSAGIPNMLM